MSTPPLPSLPSDWTYPQALDCEAALRSHMAAHGPSPEAMLALAQVALGRCAYRPALDLLNDSLSRWPEIDRAFAGVSGRLVAIGAALHGGQQQDAERWVADLARYPEILPYAAAPLARFTRGAGLLEAGRDLLAGCLTHLDPASAQAEQADTLVRGYDEALAVARSVRLISLGSGCYPWLQANRYMLRLVDASDGLMPLNMNVAVERGIVAAVEDGFEAFFDPDAFDVTTMVRDIPVGRLRRYAMLFNHECDDAFLRNGLTELSALCARRARTFLAEATTGPRVFLCQLPDVADLHRLESALAGLMRDNSYRLLILLTHLGDPSRPPSPRLSTTRLVHLPIPSPDYNWTLHDDTPEGIRYDLQARRVVLDTMRELA